MSRPNIIVLLADQLRRDVLGCYGGAFGASPAIDRFAANAVVHERHTVNCPLCVPSRISMITGLHPHQHGAIVNAWDKEEEPYGTCRNLPSLYETLAAGGYRVEHIGTDHLRFDPPLATRHERIRFLATNREHQEHLKARGFSVDYSSTRSPCVDTMGGEPVVRMYTNPNTVPWPGAVEDFLDVWQTRQVVERIERADRDEPLALFANFWLPHCPLSAPEPYFSMFDPRRLKLPETVGRWYPGQSPMQLVNLPGHVAAAISPEGWRRAWAVYLGMVVLLDECIARVLDAIRRRGLWDDTLVVLSSDHGEMLGSHRMFQKMCMYEDSIRAAMVVKPPGGRAGRRGALTQHLDLTATLLDYTGIGPAPGVGQSFRDVIESPDAPGRSEVFAEFNGNSGRSFQQRCLITPRWKYIHNHGYKPEMYDLAADPNETVNLCDQPTPPAEAADLRRRLAEWMSETGDYLPAPM